MNQTKDVGITIAIFLVLVVAFYFLGYWLIFRLGQATPLMLSVGAASLVTCWIRKRRLSTLGLQATHATTLGLNYLLPLSIAFIAYLAIWILGFGDFYDAAFLADQKSAYNLSHWNDLAILGFHVALIATISFVVSLPSILGEEIGWRGFLVPELAKIMPFPAVALVSGFIWALFHWPLMLLGLYGNDVTPLPFQLITFSIFITATGVIMAYYRLKSGSVWPAVVYHASSNIFIQKLFTPITQTHAESAWYIDEFGIVLAVTATVVAIFFLRKGNAELAGSDSHSATDAGSQ